MAEDLPQLIIRPPTNDESLAKQLMPGDTILWSGPYAQYCLGQLTSYLVDSVEVIENNNEEWREQTKDSLDTDINDISATVKNRMDRIEDMLTSLVVSLNKVISTNIGK